MGLMDEAVKEFGETMGIGRLAPDPEGRVKLEIENVGDFFIEPAEEELLVYLARPVEDSFGKSAVKALRLCSMSQGNPMPVTAGMLGEDTLVFLTRLDARSVSGREIAGALENLSRLHQAAAG